jgi:hypothetical protein
MNQIWCVRLDLNYGDVSMMHARIGEFSDRATAESCAAKLAEAAFPPHPHNCTLLVRIEPVESTMVPQETKQT